MYKGTYFQREGTPMKKNIGYLPLMGQAKETIIRILKFYMEPRSKIEFNIFFDQYFSKKSENTKRLTQNTLVNYGLIEEIEDFVFVTSNLGRKWLQSESDLELILILNDHIEYIGEFIYELSEHGSLTGDELIRLASENYGIELNDSDLSRRAQILRDTNMISVNRHKRYKIEENGRIFLNKIGIPYKQKDEDFGLRQKNNLEMTHNDMDMRKSSLQQYRQDMSFQKRVSIEKAEVKHEEKNRIDAKKEPKKEYKFLWQRIIQCLEEELYDCNTESSLKVLDIYRMIRSSNRKLQINPEDIKGVECVNQDEYCAIRTIEDIKKTMQYYSN